MEHAVLRATYPFLGTPYVRTTANVARMTACTTEPEDNEKMYKLQQQAAGLLRYQANHVVAANCCLVGGPLCRPLLPYRHRLLAFDVSDILRPRRGGHLFRVLLIPRIHRTRRRTIRTARRRRSNIQLAAIHRIDL